MKYKLMLVDDEPLVRKAFQHVINDHFQELDVVARTGNGVEAVELARRYKPDIILMDIELDGMNGLEAVEEIIKFLPQSVVTIISAYDDFSYARSALRLGVLDYLLKPLNKSDITELLKRSIRQLEEIENKGRMSISSKLDKKINKKGQSLNLPLEQEKRLLHHISLGNYNQAMTRLNDVITYCFNQKEHCQIDNFIDYTQELMAVIYRRIYNKSSLSEKEFLDKYPREEILDKLEKAKNVESLFELFKSSFKRLINPLLQNKFQEDDDPVEKARIYIENNYDQDITLDEVASEIGLSSSYLSRKFKEKYQLGFLEYLTELRINQAADLLINKNIKINEIARRVGYRDGNYFSKVFKRETGLNPSDYREKSTSKILSQ